MKAQYQGNSLSLADSAETKLNLIWLPLCAMKCFINLHFMCCYSRPLIVNIRQVEILMACWQNNVEKELNISLNFTHTHTAVSAIRFRCLCSGYATYTS